MLITGDHGGMRPILEAARGPFSAHESVLLRLGWLGVRRGRSPFKMVEEFISDEGVAKGEVPNHRSGQRQPAAAEG